MIKRQLARVMRLNSNYFAFIGGIMIATSVNLLTGMFSNDQLPDRYCFILASACFALFSGCFWTSLAWTLEPLQAIGRSTPRTITSHEDAWIQLMSPVAWGLGWRLLLGVVTAVSAVLIMVPREFAV